MEFSVFRLAIYAVIAVLLIALANTYFPLFPKNPAEQIAKDLEIAQRDEGKLVESMISFGNATLNSIAFEEDERFVAIKCTSPQDCTSDRVSFSGRAITFLKPLRTKAYSRCVKEENLYKCSVYIGKKPAQMGIEELVLAGDNASLKVKIQNRGEIKAEGIENTAVLYKKELISGKTIERLYRELSPRVITSMPEEKGEYLEFAFGNLEKGDYVVKFRTEGEDAGFDEGKKEFTIKKDIIDNCKTGEEEETILMTGYCLTKYNCTGCTYAFECRDKWKQKIPGKNFESEGTDYAKIESPPNPVTGLCGDEIPVEDKCAKAGQENTALSDGKCKAKSNCKDCATTEECLAVWSESGKTFTPGTKDYAFEIKDAPVNGVCGETPSGVEQGFCNFSAEITSANNPITGCNEELSLLKQYSTANGLTERGIDILLVESLVYTESTCISNPGNGQGLMQVVDCAKNKEPICTLEENINKGTKMLFDNYNQIKSMGLSSIDSLTLVLFSYNRGMGTARKAASYMNSEMNLTDSMFEACKFYYSSYDGCGGFDIQACCGKTGTQNGVPHTGAGLGADYPRVILNKYKNACTAVGGTIQS